MTQRVYEFARSTQAPSGFMRRLAGSEEPWLECAVDDVSEEFFEAEVFAERVRRGLYSADDLDEADDFEGQPVRKVLIQGEMPAGSGD